MRRQISPGLTASAVVALVMLAIRKVGHDGTPQAFRNTERKAQLNLHMADDFEVASFTPSHSRAYIAEAGSKLQSGRPCDASEWEMVNALSDLQRNC